MSPKIRKSAFIAITASAVFLSPCALSGATKVVVDKPKFEDLKSPDIGNAKGKNWTPKQWLEVDTKIKVQMLPEPKSKTCDAITVKWYVAVKNPDKPSTFLKLTKQVEHVNIPLNEEVHCSVYLSPASIRRLTGTDRAGKSNIEFVGFEVLVDGQVMASATSGGGDEWWAKPSKNISDSETVPLLSKADTPFANMWWDYFAEVKPKTAP